MLNTIFRFQLGAWLAGLPLFLFGITDQAIGFFTGRFAPWLNLSLWLTACAIAFLWLALCPLFWVRSIRR